MKIEFPKNRTNTNDMFYLLVDDKFEYMIYEDQDKVAEGKIYVYPVQPSSDPNVTKIGKSPCYEDAEDIFLAWFSYFYLVPGIEPPDEKVLQKYQEIAGKDI